MGIQISGSMQVLVTRDDQDAVEETVTGFGLEQASDDIQPSDDGLYYFDAIYKSYQEGYEVQLVICVDGSEASIDSVEVVNEHGNVSVEVTSDGLEVTYI